jgi:hypothetical protein
MQDAKMRVLHLPVNNGSRTSHTVRALRQKGVEAMGLVRTSASIQSPDGLKIFDLGHKRLSSKLLKSIVPWAYSFFRLVRWADILHWYSGAMALPWGLDLAIVRRLHKPGIVEWQGAEIRIPEVEFADNPYYAQALANGYEYQKYESLEQSRRLQQRFREAGFACSTPPGMLQYIQRDIFPSPFILPRRLILADYQPAYPQTNVVRPIVVHSPTAPVGKGTAAVLRAVHMLKTQHDFEFHLIQGMPRSQAVQLVKNADIFLDQFVVGDFGSAALEAMALGKPVICYIKPAVAAQYHQDLPILNASEDTLADVLAQLLANPGQRRHLGQRGRAYVEKHHDAFGLAEKLQVIYRELLESCSKP